jgi:hypothetical protein
MFFTAGINVREVRLLLLRCGAAGSFALFAHVQLPHLQIAMGKTP